MSNQPRNPLEQLRDKGWMTQARIPMINCFRSKNAASQTTGLLRLQAGSVTIPTTIPRPAQGINCLNHSSRRIEWLSTEDEKGRWELTVSLIDIWSHPIGSRVWTNPLPIPCEIMPPYLLLQCITSCGVLLNCIFTWYLKIYRAWPAWESSTSTLIVDTKYTK